MALHCLVKSCSQKILRRANNISWINTWIFKKISINSQQNQFKTVNWKILIINELIKLKMVKFYLM